MAGIIQGHARCRLGIAACVLGLMGWCALAGLTPSAYAGTTRHVVQIDARTGRVVRVVANGDTPGIVDVGQTEVWAADIGGTRLQMIDPHTGAVTVIGHRFDPSPVAIAAVGDTAYVLDGDNLNTVTSGSPSAVTTVPLDMVDGSSMLLVNGPAGVWGAKGDSVFRVDTQAQPATVHPGDVVPIPAFTDELRSRDALSGLAVGTDAVWVVGDDRDRRLWRVSATHPHVTATTALPFAPAGVAAGYGRVWITDQLENRVWELNPDSGRFVGSVAVGRDPVGITVGEGGVWVTSAIDGTITRINPATGRVSARITVPGATTQIAVGGHAVWATSSSLSPLPGGNAIRIGVVTDCYGGFGFQREQYLAGAELPLINRGARLAGSMPSDGLVGASVGSRPVKMLTGCETWADRSTTITAMSDLVERQHADVVLGPENSGDSMAVHDFAAHHPNVSFFLTGFEQSATLKQPLANVFRFEPDAVMWFAGLGAYAYNTLGWRDAATVSNADGSSRTLMGAFDTEFCALGGNISPSHRIWVDVSSGDTLGNHLPTGVDGVFLPGGTPGPFGGTDTFVPRWGAAHPPVGRHLIVGWAVLAPAPELLGVVGSSSDPYQPTPAWLRYLSNFARTFPRIDDPGFSNQPYYDEMEPLLQALARVGGDLSHGQARLRQALATLRYHSPEGLIHLDRHRQAIAPIYIAQVVRQDGGLAIRQIAVIPEVEQTFGGHFTTTTPPPGLTQPPCTHGDPPPWDRRAPLSGRAA